MTVVVGAPVVALVGRAERVSVAAAAAVRERATLGVVDAPVEPQHAVVARTGVLRQTTQLCRKTTSFSSIRQALTKFVRFGERYSPC